MKNHRFFLFKGRRSGGLSWRTPAAMQAFICSRGQTEKREADQPQKKGGASSEEGWLVCLSGIYSIMLKATEKRKAADFGGGSLCLTLKMSC